jgi:hypothetical protein
MLHRYVALFTSYTPPFLFYYVQRSSSFSIGRLWSPDEACWLCLFQDSFIVYYWTDSVQRSLSFHSSQKPPASHGAFGRSHVHISTFILVYIRPASEYNGNGATFMALRRHFLLFTVIAIMFERSVVIRSRTHDKSDMEGADGRPMRLTERSLSKEGAECIQSQMI